MRKVITNNWKTKIIPIQTPLSRITSVFRGTNTNIEQQGHPFHLNNKKTASNDNANSKFYYPSFKLPFSWYIKLYQLVTNINNAHPFFFRKTLKCATKVKENSIT